jgi:prophage regulatory protein
MGIHHPNGRYGTAGHEGAPVDEELWSLKIVLAKTGLSRSTLYTYIATGIFPLQRQLGKRRVAWFASEVKAWITSRPPTRIGMHPLPTFSASNPRALFQIRTTARAFTLFTANPYCRLLTRPASSQAWSEWFFDVGIHHPNGRYGTSSQIFTRSASTSPMG